MIKYVIYYSNVLSSTFASYKRNGFSSGKTRAVPFCVAMAALLFVSCSGCSVNGYGIPGFIEQEIDETPGAKRVRTNAKGLHFYTNEALGLQIGFIERELTYPVLSKDTDYCLDIFLRSSIINLEAYRINDYLDTPFHLQTRRAGIGMEISPYAFRNSIGFSHHRVVRFPSDASFSMYYNNVNMEEGTEVGAVIEPSTRRER